MKCTILHESKGRMRVHLEQFRMTMDQADIVSQYLSGLDGVAEVSVSERTGNAVIRYSTSREAIIQALSVFHYDDCGIEPDPSSGRALTREFQEKLFFHVAALVGKRLFLPLPVRSVITAVNSVPYIMEGLKSLVKGKIEVPLLDATSISLSMATGSFDTAGSIMFLLGLSEILEEWTHRKSVEDLARSMSLNIDQVWVKLPDGEELLMPLKDVQSQDHVIVRTSNTIPLDGVVVSGEMSVNQSSMTGESLPVAKEAGDMVYAGTVVEEGECVIEVRNTAGSGRYDRIVKMIEESERLKSDTENRAVALADGLVPYSFLATGLTYLFTRNLTRAMAVLMVDYSCALKLSMPISVLSAMREATRYKISVKGGKFMEQIAKADTIVFDKTGTLTYSQPQVAEIVTFGDWNETEVLRLAACLEEHYPHSIANAVVEEAKKRHIDHEEKHSKVEYIVAHGIASSIDGIKTVIGSYHFVFEDEQVKIPEGEQEKFDAIDDSNSHLYFAVGGMLAAVICISDPVRAEAPSVIRKLKELGFSRIVMMTGDSERTAASVAQQVGVDAYYSEVLPEDKANYVTKEQKAGHTVLMLGDGINDSPALAEADCGIAVSDGAMIAREIADVTIADENLSALVTLKTLSDRLEDRTHRNYRVIMGFNSALILLGIFGILTPNITALLHNGSTLLISMNAMTDYLKDN